MVITNRQTFAYGKNLLNHAVCLYNFFSWACTEVKTWNCWLHWSWKGWPCKNSSEHFAAGFMWKSDLWWQFACVLQGHKVFLMQLFIHTYIDVLVCIFMETLVHVLYICDVWYMCDAMWYIQNTYMHTLLYSTYSKSITAFNFLMPMFLAALDIELLKFCLMFWICTIKPGHRISIRQGSEQQSNLDRIWHKFALWLLGGAHSTWRLSRWGNGNCRNVVWSSSCQNWTYRKNVVSLYDAVLWFVPRYILCNEHFNQAHLYDFYW